jgi:hypothetical protein
MLKRTRTRSVQIWAAQSEKNESDKKSVLFLLSGAAAVHRCDRRILVTAGFSR